MTLVPLAMRMVVLNVKVDDSNVLKLMSERVADGVVLIVCVMVYE